MQIANLFQKIEKYLLFIGVSLFAVFVFPRFPSPYIVPKEIFAAVIISLVLILCSVRSIIKGESPLFIGKFDLGVALFALVYILAAAFMTPNKMEAFFYPGTVTFVIISVLFYFLINQLDKKGKDLILIGIFASGIFLSISILFTELGLFAKIPFLPSFIKDSGFNALGNWLPSVIYLTALLPIGIGLIIKDKDIVKRIFYGVASTVIVFGLVVAVVTILPGKAQSPILPDIQTSWEVAVETLKVSPILGIGTGNYLTAFNLYRSVSYNMTNLWQIRFSSSDNFYFTLLTEAGFAGLAALIILMIEIYNKFKTDLTKKYWEEISVIVIFVLFLVFPSASALLFLLMVLLAIFSGSEEKKINIAMSRIPSAIVTIPVFLGIIALGFFGTKAVAAEITYERSLVALTNNDAKGTYTLMTQAVTQNPYVDRYHASLAQVDMALATSIASNQNLTDTDRSTITQLIQQAINEGKANVTLNPERSGNWESLGQIYRSIMSFAQGADQFTIQAFIQAIALDPTNPNLRIELGGAYYALGRYSDAIDSFKLATLAKSDLANAYYNLAIAYRENKDYDNAITAMNTVLTLVDKNSSDYTLAKSTLDNLQKNKPVTTTSSTQGNLTTPEKQTTTVKPPLTLPSEATPPATNQ
ncbi:MAG: tetratricopeptide repeat protein [Candidatus Microgenomates bacterium]|jgi:tetratricopeptide (TPR) repeat protein